ncbi:hypothetical protein JNO48_09420 [Clostridiales bacterium]|nr:hypothetical protein JNO48_09420 [Clostridiales bacterium]
MKHPAASRGRMPALAILLVSVFYLTILTGAAAESVIPVPLEAVLGVWELEGVYFNGETVFSAEDILRASGKPMTMEFTTDGLWILDGAAQVEVYDVNHLADNVLPDGSHLEGDEIYLAVADAPGTTMHYVRSSLPGREGTSEVDPANVGPWVMKDLEFRTDSDSSSPSTIMTAESLSEKYSIPVPTAEVRKSGFILLTINTDTEIFPAREWEQAGDLLIWNYKRNDGTTLVWSFIREDTTPAAND